MHILPSNIEENKTNTKACLDVGHLAIQGDEFKDTVNRLGDYLNQFIYPIMMENQIFIYYLTMEQLCKII